MTEHLQSDLKHFFNRVGSFITTGVSIVDFTLEIDESVLCSPIKESDIKLSYKARINPYPTAFPYGNGMVLHFYQQQESSTTKTVHKVINKGLKTYV